MDDNLYKTFQEVGIVKGCVLNKLESFSAALQLPPCTLHDTAEGVLAYDVYSILQEIVIKKRLCTLDALNYTIKNLRFPGDKPNPITITKNRVRLGGSGGQISALMRCLPLALRLVLKNKAGAFAKTTLYEMLMRLLNVFYMESAPELSQTEISDLSIITNEYLNARCDYAEFPKIKPKHHFMSHHPGAFRAMGPLVGLSTIRFESKHKVLKAIAVKGRNFINVSQTMAVRHQRAMSHSLYNGLYPQEVVCSHDITPIRESRLTLDERDCIRAKLKDDFGHITSSLTVRGTKYSAGAFVPLHKSRDEGTMTVGKIICAVTKGPNLAYEQSFLLCTAYEAYDSGWGYFSVEKRKETIAVHFSELADFHPLLEVNIADDKSLLKGVPIVILHHYVRDS